MRFGKWRGVALALALATVSSQAARADAFHVIPKEVVAVDVNTGGPYLMPPVPYGHYAKDCMGSIHKALGLLTGGLHGCGLGGCGLGGCGLGGCGRGGCGNGDPCASCGGSGCGFCKGRGLFHGHGDPCGGGGNGCGLFGHKRKGCGLCGCKGCFGCKDVLASSKSVTPAPQAVVQPSAQCGEPGCFVKAKHHHHLRNGCGNCGGNGCGLCGGGLFQGGDPCGNCGGKGCGLCGGRGLFGGNGCGLCGGRGCSSCLGAGGLLGLPHALVNEVLHRGKVKYFMGAGGPVPIT